jgi:hypothetical protein
MASRGRHRRRHWALTTRLYVALASMAAITAIVSLLLGGMRTG